MRIDGRDRQVQRSRQAIRQPAYTSGVSRPRWWSESWQAVFNRLPTLVHRQLEFHRCPAVGISCRPQLATMVLDDRIHDCEPHSRAFGSSGENMPAPYSPDHGLQPGRSRSVYLFFYSAPRGLALIGDFERMRSKALETNRLKTPGGEPKVIEPGGWGKLAIGKGRLTQATWTSTLRRRPLGAGTVGEFGNAPRFTNHEPAWEERLANLSADGRAP